MAATEKYYGGDIGFRNVISSDIVDLSRNVIVEIISLSFCWMRIIYNCVKKEPSVRAAPSRFYTLDSSKEYRSSI